jgi:hypothetical protein
MTDERYVTLDALLPPDPEAGEVFTMPEGQVGGASTMNFIYTGGSCVGHTSQYARVANVSSHSYLGRTITSAPLTPGIIIRLLGEQFTFKSLVFVEYFGWVVHQYNPKPTVLLDAKFEVLHAVPMKKQNSNVYTYDRVCLKKHKEDTDARTANGNAARNRPPDAATNASSSPTTATTEHTAARGDEGPG